MEFVFLEEIRETSPGLFPFSRFCAAARGLAMQEMDAEARPGNYVAFYVCIEVAVA